MPTDRSGRRRPRGLTPGVESCESRLLLSRASMLRAAVVPVTDGLTPREIRRIQRIAPASHPTRPNLPVLPYAKPAAGGTFLDPTVSITQGSRIQIGLRNYVAPFATLDARRGFIKVGSVSTIQDGAVIAANPDGRAGTPGILIGDSVFIGAGAKVRGPATVGGLGVASPLPTSVGARAVIDGATIRPGAIVSEAAYVGPGVTVPADVVVLPGRSVTTDAEASDPALGKVAIQSAADRPAVASALTNARSLARVYISLYQGNAATGVSPGTPPIRPPVNNGSLAPVSGVGPGSSQSPSFVTPDGFTVLAPLPQFRSRVVGQVVFTQTAARALAGIGERNSIRADEARPFAFAQGPTTGNGVVINGRVGGSLAAGRGLVVGDDAVIAAGPGNAFGDDVTIGARAVVSNANLGNGARIGRGAVVLDSTIEPGAEVPDRAIVVDGRVVGFVEPR